MSNYRDPAFWQRRLSANSQPLGMGDQKLMMSTVLSMLDDITTKLEALDAQVQSLRSKGTTRSRKVVEANDRTAGDA